MRSPNFVFSRSLERNDIRYRCQFWPRPYARNKQPVPSTSSNRRSLIIPRLRSRETDPIIYEYIKAKQFAKLAEKAIKENYTKSQRCLVFLAKKLDPDCDDLPTIKVSGLSELTKALQEVIPQVKRCGIGDPEMFIKNLMQGYRTRKQFITYLANLLATEAKNGPVAFARALKLATEIMDKQVDHKINRYGGW